MEGYGFEDDIELDIDLGKDGKPMVISITYRMILT